MLEVIASTDDVGEARSWHLLLSSVTVPHRVVDRSEEPLPWDELDITERFCLVVSEEDADRARALMDLNREEESKRQADIAAQKPATQRSTKATGLLVALLMSVLFIAIYLKTPGFDSPLSRQFRNDASLVLGGQWFRLLTAAFLHGDAGHLFSNIGFLLPLGLFCVERLGVGSFLFAFVWTATLGNIMSVMWHGVPFVSLGASGGVFGLLGTLVGISLAESDTKHRTRALVGAGLAFLGMTAFAEKSDMAAHVFGFAAGLGFGAAALRMPRMDFVFGILAFVMTGVAFSVAL